MTNQPKSRHEIYDKIRKYILEMFPDIEYRKKDCIFYTYTKIDDHVSVSPSTKGDLDSQTMN